ncbi:MAG: hypothetical protein Q8K57_11375 [Thiobacillus sp.]|nr:hypothetical protein [Thiobacillus sp.]
MKTLMVLFVTAMLSTAIHAAPVTKGDPKVGKTLHDKSCTS